MNMIAVTSRLNMRALILAVSVLVAVPAMAQQATAKHQRRASDRADLADQRVCYKQARAYVQSIAEQDKEYAHENDKLPKELYDTSASHGIATFNLAHYEPRTKTCYVQYTREDRTNDISPTDYKAGQPEGYNSVAITTTTIVVADAFEGKEYATYCEMGVFKKTITPGLDSKYDAPSFQTETCHVLATKCSSRPEFNGLLWEYIPAFEPVNAVTVK
jgi:hypothetical protein